MTKGTRLGSIWFEEALFGITMKLLELFFVQGCIEWAKMFPVVFPSKEIRIDEALSLPIRVFCLKFQAENRHSSAIYYNIAWTLLHTDEIFLLRLPLCNQHNVNLQLLNKSYHLFVDECCTFYSLNVDQIYFSTNILFKQFVWLT